ncbi:hypothetical protein GCM10009613_60750 [Pseudonocardia kongjuensis]|uniref:Uncharacterized protein n=1 Tax=Pseudonocardia kongjuensis TaxID=102227 RepID=A0ABP4IYB1_9PSEU
MPEQQSDTGTGWGAWSLIPRADSSSGVAHRIRPAGGDDRWQTACGRVLLGLVPTPAPDGHRKCATCLRQDRPGGARYRQMPPRHGRRRTEAIRGAVAR